MPLPVPPPPLNSPLCMTKSAASASGTADLQPIELHLLNRVTPLSSRCAGHHVFHTLAGAMTYDLCYIQGQMLAEDAEMFADAVVNRLKSLVALDV